MTLADEPHAIANDAVRMIAGDDIAASLILNGDSLAVVLTFTDDRLGPMCIALGSEAAIQLLGSLFSIVNSTAEELEHALVRLRADAERQERDHG